MKKRYQSMRSFLTVILCAAMLVTAFPDVLRASATSDGEETVSDEIFKEGSELERRDEGNGQEMTADGEDEPALEDTAVPIFDYQTKKLKVKKTKITVYNGQRGQVVAKVAYDEKTNGDGRNFTAYVTDEKGSRINWRIKVYSPNDQKNEDVLVDTYLSTGTGKYTIHLLPVVPEGVYAQETAFSLTVKSKIDYIRLDMPSRIYRKPGAATSFQVLSDIRSYGDDSGKPASKKVEWDAAWDESFTQPCDPSEVRIKNGKVTIQKNFKIPENEGKRGFYVRAKAADFKENTVYGYAYTEVYEKPLEPAGITFVNGKGEPWNKDTFTYGEAKNDRVAIRVQDEAGNALPTGMFQLTLSDTKNLSVDAEGNLSILEWTDKPVVITATAKDGGKCKAEATLNLKKKEVSVEDITLEHRMVEQGNIVDLGKKTGYTHSRYHSIINQNPFSILLYVKGGEYSGTELYDVSIVQIKGAKDLTAAYKAMWKGQGSNTVLDGINRYFVLPTAQEIEITIAAGGETKTFQYTGVDWVTGKFAPQKGEKLTTSATVYKTDAPQEIRLYMGKENVGRKVTMYDSFEFKYSNYANYLITNLLSSQGLYGINTVKEDGYVTIRVSKNLRQNIRDSHYFDDHACPKSITLQMVIREDGSEKQKYESYPITIKLSDVKEKNDYKMKTSYDLQTLSLQSADGESLVLGDRITSAGKKKPQAVLKAASIEGGLSDDRKEADVWVCALSVRQVQNGEDTDWYLAVTSEGKALLDNYYKDQKKAAAKLRLTYKVEMPYRTTFEKTVNIKVTYNKPAVPQSSFVSSAVEATAKPVTGECENATFDGEDEPALDDAAVDLETYQTKKLTLTKEKNTVIFSGQSGVKLATVGYDSKTKDEGRDFEWDIRDKRGSSCKGDFSLDKGDAKDMIRLSASGATRAGKYTLSVWPATPVDPSTIVGVHVQTTSMTFTVKPGSIPLHSTAPSISTRQRIRRQVSQ